MRAVSRFAAQAQQARAPKPTNMPSSKTTGKYTSVVVARVAFTQWLAVVVVTSVRRCVVTCHLLCSRGASGGVDTTAFSCSSKSDLEAGEIVTVTQEPVESEYESADDRIEIVIIATATSASLTRLLQSEADASSQNNDTPGSGSMSGGGYDNHEVYVPAEPESEPIVCLQSASADPIVAANKEDEGVELKAIESDDDQAAAVATVTNESERASNINEDDILSDNACLPSVCLEIVDGLETDEEDLEYDTLTDSSSASMSDFDYEGDDEEDNDDEDLGFHRTGVLDEMIERLLQLNHDMEDDWSSYCTMFE